MESDKKGLAEETSFDIESAKFALLLDEEPSCDYSRVGCGCQLVPLRAQTIEEAREEAYVILFGNYDDDGELDEDICDVGYDLQQRSSYSAKSGGEKYEVGLLIDAVLIEITKATSILDSSRKEYYQRQRSILEKRAEKALAMQEEQERKEYARLQAKFAN
jgi:hypothetical protein